MIVLGLHGGGLPKSGSQGGKAEAQAPGKKCVAPVLTSALACPQKPGRWSTRERRTSCQEPVLLLAKSVPLLEGGPEAAAL